LDHSGFDQYRISQGSITDLHPDIIHLVDTSAGIIGSFRIQSVQDQPGSITDLSPGNLVDTSARDQVPDYSARYHLTWSPAAGNNQAGITGSFRIRYRIVQLDIITWSPAAGYISQGSQDHSGFDQYRIRYRIVQLDIIHLVTGCRQYQARDHRIIQDSINTGSARDQ